MHVMHQRHQRSPGEVVRNPAFYIHLAIIHSANVIWLLAIHFLTDPTAPEQASYRHVPSLLNVKTVSAEWRLYTDGTPSRRGTVTTLSHLALLSYESESTLGIVSCSFITEISSILDCDAVRLPRRRRPSLRDVGLDLS